MGSRIGLNVRVSHGIDQVIIKVVYGQDTNYDLNHAGYGTNGSRQYRRIGSQMSGRSAVYFFVK